MLGTTSENECLSLAFYSLVILAINDAQQKSNPLTQRAEGVVPSHVVHKNREKTFHLRPDAGTPLAYSYSFYKKFATRQSKACS